MTDTPDIESEAHRAVRGVQMTVAFDLWRALDVGDQHHFERHVEVNGWATTWAQLTCEVRDRLNGLPAMLTTRPRFGELGIYPCRCLHGWRSLA